MAPARSEARKAAAFPTSESVVTRPSTDLALSDASISSVGADQFSVEAPFQLSGMPSSRKQTARMPLGPSSAASCLVSASMAVQAIPKPPTYSPGV